MRKEGIDVSKYQGDINWDQVKEQIDFAIIRCGFGGNDTQYDDPKYFQNADACTRLNIPFGVYLFSYATNTSEAISEAEHVLRLVRDYKLTYPIYYDVENNSIQKNLSNEQLTSICETFCNKIEASGYYVGIYSNLYWFETKLSSTRLDRYDKWVAQWANKPTYDRPFGMWQYTSDGSINGINGRVDRDIAFIDYPTIIKQAGLNHLDDKTEADYYTYTVVKGDTLWKIGKKYNVSWREIAKYNNIKFPYTIYPDQTLKIPITEATSSNNFKVGEQVVFKDAWNIYPSINSTVASKATYDGGTITKIFPSALNELQLNNTRGYVRISDVRKK